MCPRGITNMYNVVNDFCSFLFYIQIGVGRDILEYATDCIITMALQKVNSAIHIRDVPCLSQEICARCHVGSASLQEPEFSLARSKLLPNHNTGSSLRSIRMTNRSYVHLKQRLSSFSDSLWYVVPLEIGRQPTASCSGFLQAVITAITFLPKHHSCLL